MSKKRAMQKEGGVDDSTKKQKFLNEIMPESQYFVDSAKNESIRLYQVFKSLYRSGKYQEAKAALTEAAELDQTSVDFFYGLGVVYNKLGEYEKAIISLVKATKIAPTQAESFHALGSIYAKLGRYQESVEPFIKATKYNSTKPNWFHDLGIAYSKLGDYQNAVIPLTKATDLSPDSGRWFCDLANIYGKLGDYKKVISPLEKAKDLYPQNIFILNGLSDCYIKSLKEKESGRSSKEKKMVKVDTLIKLANVTSCGDKKQDLLDEAIKLCLAIKHNGSTYLKGVEFIEKSLPKCNFIEPNKRAEIYHDMANEYLSRGQKTYYQKALSFFEYAAKLNNEFLNAYEKAVITCSKICNSSAKKYQQIHFSKAIKSFVHLKSLYESLAEKLDESTGLIKDVQSIILGYVYESPIKSIVVAGDDLLTIEVVE